MPCAMVHVSLSHDHDPDVFVFEM